MKQLKTLMFSLLAIAMSIVAFTSMNATAFLFNSVIAASVAIVLQATPIQAVMLIVLFNGVAIRTTSRFFTTYLRSGLIKEVWMTAIDNYKWYKDNSFLNDAIDWNEYVGGNGTILNGQIAGAAPSIVINRNSFPATISDASADTPWQIGLDHYSTEPIRVSNLIKAQSNYAIMELKTSDALKAIEEEIAKKGLWAISPTADATKTPVFVTTGNACSLYTNNRKSFTETDLSKLTLFADQNGWPQMGRTIVMSPIMFRDWVDNNTILNQQMAYLGSLGKVDPIVSGLYYKGWIFKMRQDGSVYRLVSSVWTKRGYGAALTASTDFDGATAYVSKQSFGAAVGASDINLNEKRAEWMGDVLSIEQLAIVTPKTQTFLAQIIATT